ncbi:pseudouridine synthase [Pararhodospirillum oryzae]|uniref:Pseudouridine synthase n=1 Tax=Pararhodospirillum oryzae TaxID=478448 RepID=A0A512H3F3_9PROT|nr:pseudouridine synthase [Pararhodospirillum oryzae]GEO79977.1 pseudouridine synthase [Pararhodospirillum oryzae]
MARLILLNKPFDVLSQFTDKEERATLASLVPVPDVYVCGRLDRDSEGLLLLTDEGAWQHRISHPRHKMPKTYWAQVEGVPEPAALKALCEGVTLADGPARALEACVIPEPAGLWPRTPPVRFRRHIPTTWIRLGVAEGRNRLVRRMTAAVGLPTLRLIRWSIGPWTLEGLEPGCWREETLPPCPTDGPPRRSGPWRSRGNFVKPRKGAPTPGTPSQRKGRS